MSIPKNLPQLVKSKYNAAKAAEDLIFSPTELRIIHANGVPVCTSFALPADVSLKVPVPIAILSLP